MLALLVATFLIFVGGSLSQDSECLSPEREACNEIGEGFVNGFPTERSMAQYADYKERASCIVAALRKCDEEDTEYAHYIGKLLLYFETVLCREGSPTFEALSNNLRCIRDSQPQVINICKQERKRNDALDDFILNTYKESDDPTSIERCLLFVLELSCNSIAYNEQCGEAVGDALMELGLKLDTYHANCPQDFESKIAPYLGNVLKSAEQVEQAIKRK